MHIFIAIVQHNFYAVLQGTQPEKQREERPRRKTPANGLQLSRSESVKRRIMQFLSGLGDLCFLLL